MSSRDSSQSSELSDFWWSYLEAGGFTLRLKKSWEQVEAFLSIPPPDKKAVDSSLKPLVGPGKVVPACELLEGVPTTDLRTIKDFVFRNLGLFEVAPPREKAALKEAKKGAESFVRDKIDLEIGKRLEQVVKWANEAYSKLKDLPVPGLWELLARETETAASSVDLERGKLRVIAPLAPPVKKVNQFLRQLSQVHNDLAKVSESFRRKCSGYSKPAWGDPPTIWFEVSRILKRSFTCKKPWWAEVSPVLEDTCEAFQVVGAGAGGRMLGDLIDWFEEKHAGLGEDLLHEWCYALKVLGFLPEVAPGAPGRSEKTERKLAVYLNLLVLPVVTDLWEREISEAAIEEPSKFNDALQEISSHQSKRLERTVLGMVDRGELAEAKEFIGAEMDSLKGPYDELRGVFDEVRPFFAPHDHIVDKFLEVVTTCTQALGDKAHELTQQVRSIEDEIQLAKLREFVDGKVASMEKSLDHYERESSELVSLNAPIVERVRNLLSSFKEKFHDANGEVSREFKRYAKELPDLDVFPVLKNWEKVYGEINNRVKIVLSALMTRLLEPFKPIIEEEKDFFKSIGNQEASFEDLPLNFSFELLSPSKLSEVELRDRLNRIDQKLVELDRVVDLFTIQKEKYENALSEAVRRRRGIEATQCVVCHKVIDFAREEVIKCPHCGCISHRLCSLAYIEEHNNCPVCNNSYLIPDGRIYSNEVEYFDENIDFQGGDESEPASSSDATEAKTVDGDAD
ncbi:MAG: hypothetical protein ACTSU5_12525 [Promethearchaeota archaeon]